ncbi:MAG: alginate lyase family protein [Anaerolineae bacterium]|nr:alginate lyase family protein [Anaerolineae bacterium]
MATYGRWRIHRFVRRCSERFTRPHWPIDQLPQQLTSDFRRTLPNSLDEISPALQHYFQNRPLQSHLHHEQVAEVVKRMPPALIKQTLIAAEEIKQKRFIYRGVEVAFDGDINWQHQPGGNIDWTWDLNRHYGLITLARAYAYTQDETYAETCINLLQSWMAANPPRVNSPVWRPFEISTRLNGWLWIFFLLMPSNYFGCHGLVDMLTGIAVQAKFLEQNLEYHIENNHLLLEAKTLAMVGLLLPELAQAAKWQKVGLQVTWQQFAAQVRPDGVHGEQSSQYHLLVGSEMWELLRVLNDTHCQKPAWVDCSFQKMINFARAIVKPDQTIPLFGDASRTDKHIRFDFRWAKSGMPGDPDEETVWLLSPTEDDSAPSYRAESAGFADGGYFILRDSVPKEPYLAFDCGPFGHIPVPSHGHSDTLSFELFAHGKTLITDCGAYRYHAPGKWRNYFRGTRAHNTVMVDGQDQSLLIGNQQVENPAQATLERWQTHTHLDWVEGSHSGYRRLPNPIVHRRKILFVKPDYWLMIDNLEGNGHHQFDWFYHFVPDAHVKIDKDSGAVVGQVDQVALLVQPFEPKALEMKVVSGLEPEIQGWVALESGQKEPAPVAVVSCQSAAPLCQGTLLFPHHGLSPVKFELLKSTATYFALKISFDDQVDVVLISKNSQVVQLIYDDWQTTASHFILRQSPSGQYRLIATDVTNLQIANRLIFEQSEPQALLTLDFNDVASLAHSQPALEIQTPERM